VRVLLLILVPLPLLFGLALLLMWLPLPAPFPAAQSQGRNLMAAIVVGVLGLGYLAGLTIYLRSTFRGAGQTLDEVFVSRELTAESYQGVGRQYRGQVDGHPVEVNFVPAQSVQRALLNIYVIADVGTRIAIGEGRPGLDCRDCPRLDASSLGMGTLHVLADDRERASDLLADPANRAVVSQLMASQQECGLRELYLQPGRIWLRARPSSCVSDVLVGQWLDDLLTLAAAVEQVE
jgi:hypothetical protein